MDSNKNLQTFVNEVVKACLDEDRYQSSLSESTGKEPTKEQIDATFDLLKGKLQGTKWAKRVFVAGGAVRDMIMGFDPKDIDIVVEMEEGGIRLAELLAKQLGIFKAGSNPVIFPKFGTAKIALDGVEHNGVMLDGVDVEFVYTRKEEYTKGSRKPTTRFGTIKQDVFRRDLTINSLLMNLVSGEIVDLTGRGRDDIAKGVIRTPSEPDSIFSDDPLRLMRAVRFAGRYDYSMPDFMTASIKKNARQLVNISRERVREELQKILVGANPEVGIRFLFDLGLMPFVLPSIAGDKEGAMEGARRGVGFEGKLIHMLKNIPSKLAAKEVRGLKFSNDEVDVITAVLSAIQTIEKDHSAASILRAGTDLFNKGFKKHVSFLKPLDKQVQQLEPFFSKGPVVHVSPDDLMQRFNLKPGAIIGKLVKFQKELWYKNPRVTKDEVLAQIEQEL